MVASALEGCGSGSQSDKELHEVILLLSHIYHLEPIYRRLTVSIHLINLPGFYSLSYALKLGVPNCIYLCNQGTGFLPWVFKNFIFLALVCYSHLRRSFWILIFSFTVLAIPPSSFLPSVNLISPTSILLSKPLIKVLCSSGMIL